MSFTYGRMLILETVFYFNNKVIDEWLGLQIIQACSTKLKSWGKLQNSNAQKYSWMSRSYKVRSWSDNKEKL